MFRILGADLVEVGGGLLAHLAVEAVQSEQQRVHLCSSGATFRPILRAPFCRIGKLCDEYLESGAAAISCACFGRQCDRSALAAQHH
jgi:hypothetical protein